MHLTPRQTQVLALVAQGLRNRVVAERLGITETTVETTLSNIYARLGLNTRDDPDLDVRVCAVLHYLAWSD